MTQFKDKSKKHPEYVNAGLFNYPVLMAADILLYDTDIVPIGKDQTQHVEITRNIAERFNKKYGKTFKLPQALVPEQGAIIMSLENPEKKMSKTDDAKGCISLFEEPKDIMSKIMAATTDSEKEIKYDTVKKKGISNLLTIYSLFSGKTIKQIEKEFKGRGYGEFKKSLAELLIEKLEPIREKRKELKKNHKYVNGVLEKGAKRARNIAENKMEEVRKKVGLR